MSKRIYTQEQRTQLEENTNVVRCSERSITYAVAFKRRAVKQYNEEGLPSREIFAKAGFNLSVIGRKTPKECLVRWNRTYRTKGLEGLKESRGVHGRGGKKKITNLTSAQKIKVLEAEVSYLKAENDFLAKLRAKRSE